MKDPLGESPLHWAAKRGYQKLVLFLVEHGADLLYVDLTGKKAKDFARNNGFNDLGVQLNRLERYYIKEDI